MKPAIAAGIEERIVLVLFDLANHLQRRGERLAAEAGITTLQWLVLLQIAGDPNFGERRGAADQPVLASDIARERGLSKPTISAVVNALKERGLIREDRDAADRRRRRLVITAQGSRVIEQIEPHRHSANRRLLADLAVGDRRKLLAYLESCLGVLWGAYEDERLAVAQSRLERTR
jgi:DNA-binding MarR family transcriptional regulator